MKETSVKQKYFLCILISSASCPRVCELLHSTAKTIQTKTSTLLYILIKNIVSSIGYFVILLEKFFNFETILCALHVNVFFFYFFYVHR